MASKRLSQKILTSSGSSISLAPHLIEHVLGSGALDGFTPGTAKRLVGRFGSQAVSAIESWDIEAKAILGERWNHASDEILEHAEAIPMLSFLLKRGFSGLMARKTMIWQRHESEWSTPAMAMAAWEADPYLLSDIPGITFERADRIALEQGTLADSKERLLACAREALRMSCDDAGGGARLPDAQNQARKLLAMNGALEYKRVSELAQSCLDLAASEGIAKMTKDEAGKPMVFSAELYEAEERAAHVLLEMLEERCPLKVDDLSARIEQLEATTGLTLHDEQRKALSVLFQGRVSVICGKPGSGKTTLLKCAAPLLEDGAKKVLYAAPTGKAAKRMSQSLGRQAVTLHRLLSIGRGEGGPGKKKIKFADEAAAIALRYADAVVVDESSMLDSKMFLRLLKALGPRTSLILVGDPQQLPSVGAGKVLRDLIDSGRVPTAIMTKIMRQSANSSITTVARSIGDGAWVDFRERDSDCLFLDAQDATQIAPRIAKMLLGAARSKYDPMKDCQILCAGNKGPAGVHAMNVQLQNALNPPSRLKAQSEIKEGMILRVGDKVMQLTNDYEREIKAKSLVQAGVVAENEVSPFEVISNAASEVTPKITAADVDVDVLPDQEIGVKKGVFNGDVGYIEEISERPLPGKVLVRFDDGVAQYEFKEAASALTLAYACTVHKFQGSEAPLIYFVMHESAPSILRTRNLVYTAITRAKSKCIVMGSESALRQAVSRDALAGRRTRLKGLLDGSISVDETASAENLARSERQAFKRLVEEKMGNTVSIASIAPSEKTSRQRAKSL